MKALVFDRLEYICAHTRTSLVIVAKKGQRLRRPQKTPLRVQDREWPVGTHFTYLGGSKTSAGFVCLDFTGLTPFTYVGIFDNLDGRLACFKQRSAPRGGYFAFHETEFGLVFGTDAAAGRVIEMTAARWIDPAATTTNSGAIAPPTQQQERSVKYYEIKPYLSPRRRAHRAGRSHPKGRREAEAKGQNHSRPRRSDGPSPQRRHRCSRLVEAS